MTWMLYNTYVSSLSGDKKRRFLMDAEDWNTLRALDNAGFNETDLSTGGI